MDNGKYEECIEAIKKGDYDKVKKLSFDDKKEFLILTCYLAIANRSMWNELLENMFTTREEVLEIAKVSSIHVEALLCILKKLSDEDKIEILGEKEYELNIEEKTIIVASMADNKKKIEALIKIKKDFEPSGLVTVIASMTDNGITDLESMLKVLELFGDKFKDKTELGPSLVTIIVATKESSPGYHQQILKEYKNNYPKDERYKNIELIPKDDLKVRALKIFDELSISQIKSIITSMKEDKYKLEALDTVKDRLISDELANIISTMDSDDYKFKALAQFENKLKSHGLASIIVSMKIDDQMLLIELDKYKDKLKSSDLARIIIRMESDNYKFEALELYNHGLVSKQIADIIYSMKTDDYKFKALAKHKNELKLSNLTDIIKSIKADGTKLAALDEVVGVVTVAAFIVLFITESEKNQLALEDMRPKLHEIIENIKSTKNEIAEIIKSMKDENIFKALEQYGNILTLDNLTDIIKSMKDENKFKALDLFQDKLESVDIADIIKSMKDENKFKALVLFQDKLESFEIADIIKSMETDENKFKALDLFQDKLASYYIDSIIGSMETDKTKFEALKKCIDKLLPNYIVPTINQFDFDLKKEASMYFKNYLLSHYNLAPENLGAERLDNPNQPKNPRDNPNPPKNPRNERLKESLNQPSELGSESGKKR